MEEALDVDVDVIKPLLVSDRNIVPTAKQARKR